MGLPFLSGREMDNIKNKLRALLSQIQSNSQLKGLKTLPVYFFYGASAIRLNLEDFKKEIIKLIKNDDITIFGGLYSKFNSLSQELIDDYLRNNKLFRYIEIGVPDDFKK